MTKLEGLLAIIACGLILAMVFCAGGSAGSSLEMKKGIEEFKYGVSP